MERSYGEKLLIVAMESSRDKHRGSAKLGVIELAGPRSKATCLQDSRYDLAFIFAG